MSRIIIPIIRKPTHGGTAPLEPRIQNGDPKRGAQPKSRFLYGQGMVEFALVLPLLLLLFFGIMELGRLLIIYTSVHAASREGARYGSAAGLNDAGVPYYLDTDGITAAARRIATLVGADVELPILYDHGDPSDVDDFTATLSSEVILGDRVIVTVAAQYNPMLGLTPLQPFEIFSTTSRTIVKPVAIGPSGHEGWNETDFPPVVDITSPVQPPDAPYEIFEGDTLEVHAIASDPEEGDLTPNIAWSLDTTPYGACSGGSCTFVGLPPGFFTIIADVTDSDGNYASDDLQIFVNPKPVVTILTPLNNQHFFELRTVSFSGEAHEEYEGDLSDDIHWFDNGVPFGTGASFDVFGMSIGLHTIRAEVADSDGQTAIPAEITIVIEPLTPPTVAITSPPNNSRVALDDNVVFTGSATDAQDGNLSASIIWTYDGGIALGTGASVSISTLSIGWHTITASVTDSDLMTATTSISVQVVQNQPPIVHITSPNNGNDMFGVYMGTPLTFSATANDDLDGNLSSQIHWTSDTGQVSHTGASFTISSLPVGVHVVTATATDRQGLSGSDSILITITNAPPDVTIVSPPYNSYYSDQQNVNLLGTATDPGVGDISNSIVWSSSIDGALGTGNNINTTNLSVGVHNIRAYVQDAGGLWDEHIHPVTIWNCPYSGTMVWAYQNVNSANSVTWSLNIPSGTPRPPTYFLNYLSITRPAGSSASINTITVEGNLVPIHVNGSTFEVLNPVWSGNFRPDPDSKIEVRFNFSTRPSVGSGPFIFTASFTGCSNISVNPTVPPRP